VGGASGQLSVAVSVGRKGRASCQLSVSVGKEGSVEVCILRRELIEREKLKPRASNRKLLDHSSKR
jgi:hypothetical protein